jgi:hypothetical protein
VAAPRRWTAKSVVGKAPLPYLTRPVEVVPEAHRPQHEPQRRHTFAIEKDSPNFAPTLAEVQEAGGDLVGSICSDTLELTFSALDRTDRRRWLHADRMQHVGGSCGKESNRVSNGQVDAGRYRH